MTGFVLNYGTEDNGHVEMDMQADKVRHWRKGVSRPETYTLDEFEKAHPEIVNEMIRNGVLRKK